MKLKIFTLLCTLPLFSIAQLPAGSVAAYSLNNNGTDAGSSAYNGMLNLATGTTNRFSKANSAIALVSNVSTGTLPAGFVAAMQNNFSVGFWIKTNMTGATGANWYNASSLVDGEVGGVTNDWGIGLVDGGKICFGVGNPDITIKSTAATYNNNAWHFITATRNKTAGTIFLYVDGIQVATTTGINTASLTAPAVIGLGRSSAVATGMYTGSLDDFIAYNRVLTATEVGNLYNYMQAVALPLQWVSFAGVIKTNTVELTWETANSINNDHFDIQQSTDGTVFSFCGTIADKDGTATAANGRVYHFSSALPAGDIYYYRIKQVDLDGKSTLSKIIRLQTSTAVAGLRLLANPVAAELMLQNNTQHTVKKLQVLDLSGHVVTDKTVNTNSTTIKVTTQQLIPGHYILRIISDSGSSNISFIKQ